MNRKPLPAIAMTLILLTACSDTGPADAPAPGDTSPQATTAPAAAPAIAWFDGDVQAAFDTAAASGKPLYLYWGAVWCPPCQEIKHTVFKSSTFIRQSELFVAVYLDGDSPRAQAWGERFDVQGYPTMIVFDPSGTEITRIPGGIDIARYESVLGDSLDSMRPTPGLLSLPAAELTPADYRQLAWYSWWQAGKHLPDDHDPAVFETLAAAAPDKVTAARLYLTALAMAEERSEEAKRPDARTRIEAVLDDPELVIACWDFLAYGAESLVPFVTATPAEQADLVTRWHEAMLAARDDPALSIAERLGAWFPALEVLYADESTPIPPGTLDELRADVAEANRLARNPFLRQSVVNQMNHVLQGARLLDEAETLLLAEVERSRMPYYFMSSLAGLAEKRGDLDGAIDWRRKAWEASTGPATRFQWGASYARTLVRLAAGSKPAPSGGTPPAAEVVAAQLLDELADPAELFAGRNFRVLRSLLRDLDTLEGDAAIRVTTLRQRIAGLCATQAEDSPTGANCQSLDSATS